jgi:hypothetical protein
MCGEKCGVSVGMAGGTNSNSNSNNNATTRYGVWWNRTDVPVAERVPLETLGYVTHAWSNGKTWPQRIRKALPEALKNVEVRLKTLCWLQKR